jgi:hypothetical protein
MECSFGLVCLRDYWHVGKPLNSLHQQAEFAGVKKKLEYGLAIQREHAAKISIMNGRDNDLVSIVSLNLFQGCHLVLLITWS